MIRSSAIHQIRTRSPMILDRVLEQATQVNGLYLDPSELISAVSAFSEALMLNTGNTAFEVSNLGTGAKILYRDRYLIVASRHQLKEIEPEHVVIQSGRPHRLVSSGSYSYLYSNSEDEDLEAYDLCALDFTEPVASGALSRNGFYRLNEDTAIRKGERIVFGMNFGFPYSDQIWDLADCHDLGAKLQHLGLRVRPTGLVYAGRSFDDSVSKWAVEGKDIPNPNGLSGSPVFAVTETRSKLVCKFAGITVRGGKRTLHAVNCERVLNLLGRAT